VHPWQFLDLAILLKGGHASPASYRTAVSRAYYAAFHLGVGILRAIGIQLGDGPAAHGELRHCLGASNDADLEDARDLLRSLHARRIRADYRMDDTVVETRKEADLACREATEAKLLFEALSNSPDGKNTAVMAMKQFARHTLGLRVL
jgi:uncharacterized protein (UPF0332 family)